MKNSQRNSVLAILLFILATKICFSQANLSPKWDELTGPDFIQAVHQAQGVCVLPFGIIEKSGVPTSDPAYAKKMYEDRIGKTYYSFDHKGYHFVVLDSIQPTEDRLWEARIDEKQMSWLADDLKIAGPGTPVIGVVHVPLVTAFGTFAANTTRPGNKYNTLTVANSPQVLAAFEGHNVIAVLQGHTHVNEIVQYKNTKFITGGAVCGNWWHGPRMGVPEGFTVASLHEGKITTRYEPSGFQSVDVREKF